MIQAGKPLDRFIPKMSDCHTFADQVLKHYAMRKSYRTMRHQREKLYVEIHSIDDRRDSFVLLFFLMVHSRGMAN